MSVTATQAVASVPSTPLEEKAPIVSIESLFDISEDQPLGTIYLMDIDDVLFAHPAMLGSRAWRSYFSTVTNSSGFENCLHDVVTLYLAENFPVISVEEKTAAWVARRQSQSEVYALTARERHMWYYTPRKETDKLTVQQLHSVHIDLSKASPSTFYHHFTQVSEFYAGIFFSDLDSKGDYIHKVLGKCSSKPVKVVFIDDKKEHVQSVADSLTKLGIPNTCYWLRAIDKKPFDSKIADVQLYYAVKERRMLSDQEAIAIQSSDINYLQEALRHLAAIK